ncbi:MAG: PspA-associated protein PspAB [Acidimicrobiales bacterium]|jgi:hypothetical protein
MGLLNTLLGRTKPVQANLDSLFGLPSATITLQSAAGLSTSGRAGVCYKPPTGQSFTDMQAEVMRLLTMDGGGTLRTAQDAYGYHWVVVENPDVEALVSQVHLVNSSLSDAGWGSQLLCSVFGLAPVPDAGPVSDSGATVPGPGTVLPSTSYLVYLFKRGTFYPFVPDGKEHRDTGEELKLKSLVADDLAVEPELDRWFPLWDLPVG